MKTDICCYRANVTKDVFISIFSCSQPKGRNKTGEKKKQKPVYLFASTYI